MLQLPKANQQMVQVMSLLLQLLLQLATHLPSMPAAPAAAMPSSVVPGPPASHDGMAQRVFEASQRQEGPTWLTSAACCCVGAGCLAGASNCCRVVEGTTRGLAALALTSIRRTCRVLNEPLCCTRCCCCMMQLRMAM